MKKTSLDTLVYTLRGAIVALIMILVTLAIFSFSYNRYNDFLKQLGLNKSDADTRITYSLLHGGFDTYGIKKLKAILINDRVTIVKEAAIYAKTYSRSDAFKKEYNTLKERNRPVPEPAPATPDKMRQDMIDGVKDGIKKTEESLKKAPDNMKSIFEKTLEQMKKDLVKTEDPDNKNVVAYRNNYEKLKAMIADGNAQAIKRWEAKYPADPSAFIKPNLESFLKETENIDFDAETVTKNGIKYFVNRSYESKGNRWKMAYRAGKPAVEAAREIVSQWLSEIK